MSFWITEAYPLSPPMVFVNPTATMQVDRNHDYVSPDGTVFLPYLNSWNASRSNLSEVINTCKSVFSNFPPVHAKSPAPPAAQPPPYAAQPPPPSYNAYAAGNNNAKSPGYPMNGSEQSPPPPPPYPSGAGAAAVGKASSQNLVTRTSASEKADLEAKKQFELKTARQAVQIKLGEEYRRFREESKKSLRAEIATQKKLETGHQTLIEGIEALERQQSEFQDATLELKTKRTQLTSWLEEYERKGGDGDSSAMAQPNLDEAIVPADAASRQLFDCVSDINAVDDVLYRLDKALSNDIIDLPTFLKEVRKLSRKQFMARALAIKIQKYQQKVEIQSREPLPLNSRPPAYYDQCPIEK